MTSASKDFSYMFRIKFTTKCKFRIFPNININGTIILAVDRRSCY